MKIAEIWFDQYPPPPDSSKPFTNTIWSCSFSPDGRFLLTAVGNVLLIYNASTGQLERDPLKTKHEGDIYAVSFAKDGKKFATAGADKNVIIWNHSLEPLKKYSHSDSVQCLGFNPITGHLFSGSSSEWVLWSPEGGDSIKEKAPAKINCCAWSQDGQLLAMGMANGMVVVKQGKTEKGKIQRKAPVWCVEWTPMTAENTESMLVVGCWDQTLSIYDSTGKQVVGDKSLDFDPLSFSFFGTGEFFIVSGTNKKVSLWTRELTYIGDICERNSWVWNAKVRPKQMHIAACSNDGSISMHELTFSIVHGLYKERYASRDMLTDIVVQHLVNDQKIRIKCRELVKKVSIYKDRLAAQLNDKVYIYVASQEDKSDIKYKIHKKINRKIECSLMVVVSNHVIFCQNDKVALLRFTGEIEREWVFEAPVRYMKPVGGAPGKEGVLVGLKNGDALELFLDNPFPVVLMKQGVSIRILDLSLNKRKLAIVDDNSNLTVYDLVTKETLFQELNVMSVAWNTEMDDLLAYSGAGLLSIKMGNFPPIQQKLNGFIVGFRGSKLFYLSKFVMMTMDMPQTTNLMKFIEKKDYVSAFRVACLGGAEQDFKALGIEALQNGSFEIARKCFHRIKEMAYIELLNRHEKDKGVVDSIQLQAEVLAYQAKTIEAAQLLEKNGKSDKAIELLMECRKWDEARKIAKKTGDLAHHYLKMIAKAAANNAQGDDDQEKSAMDLVESGDYKQAIEILGNLGKTGKLTEICRDLDKSENEDAIRQCAYYFKKLNFFPGAREAYLKLGDLKQLLQCYIDFGRWDEATSLAKTNPEFSALVHEPYAEWLEKNDQFEEAQREYKYAGKHDRGIRIIEQLSKNAIIEQRFTDASYFFWLLSLENLKLVSNTVKPSYEDQKRLDRYYEFDLLSEVYFAYNSVHLLIEEPFQHTGKAFQKRVFNACKFILGKMNARSPLGVSKIYLFYALAKISKFLEAYQTARIAYEKLGNLKIPLEWIDEIEFGNLMVRSKPFSDREDVIPICNRCVKENQSVIVDETCTTCFHKFTRSLISFEILPLVEFKLDQGISDKRFIELLSNEQKQMSPNKKMLIDQTYGHHQSMQMGDENSPFNDKLAEVCDMQITSHEYIPVVVDEKIIKSMKYEEVYIVDLTKHCKGMEIKYYKNMLPDEPLKLCKYCFKFFLLDEYELALLDEKKCPFCKNVINVEKGDL